MTLLSLKWCKKKQPAILHVAPSCLSHQQKVSLPWPCSAATQSNSNFRIHSHFSLKDSYLLQVDSVSPQTSPFPSAATVLFHNMQVCTVSLTGATLPIMLGPLDLKRKISVFKANLQCSGGGENLCIFQEDTYSGLKAICTEGWSREGWRKG